MRSFPIHAAAFVAQPKFVIQAACAFRQPVDDRLLTCGMERRIASQAARKRRERANEIKALDNFHELPSRIRLTHEMAVRNLGALQQSAVTRQQDSMLIARHARQIGIAVIIAI